jgi:ParB family transcriptional regulator, chromosome partitioning protein
MTPTLITLDVDQLKPNAFQPRKMFDEEALSQLASSIQHNGLLQPVVARKTKDGYEIVAGERRWRACQKAQIHAIPVLLRHFSDEQSAIAAISENTDRENLSLMELAHAFHRLSVDFNMTQKEIGEIYDVHEKKVTHVLRILSLEEEVQAHIENKQLSLGHAKIILSAPKSEHIQLSNAVVNNHWSVRELEKRVKLLLSPAPPGPKKSSKDTDIIKLENELGQTVGLPTQIEYSASGSGEISFKFSSLEEFEGLLIKLQSN